MIISPVAALAAFAAAALSPIDEFKGWEKKIVEESVDIGAFEHSDFEASKPGIDLKCGEIGRYGINGGGGMRIRPPSNKYSFVMPLKARLEKGKRYIFSADIRRSGKAWGAPVMDAKFAKTGKYASGCGAWGTCSKKLSDGWTHQYVEVVAKHEPEDMQYYFMIYCGTPDPTNELNYIEVDNIRIDVAAPSGISATPGRCIISFTPTRAASASTRRSMAISFSQALSLSTHVRSPTRQAKSLARRRLLLIKTAISRSILES